MKKELILIRKRLKILQLMCKRLRIIRDEYHKKFKPKIRYIYDK
jgi:hypothetical protein